ncbi:helix-turn-helix domain-containing protein [Myroides sp. M-43]|uniref:helix-turn-helix domain-containing protein n=1 Tax=Myroides oncorhynchi TaxID=2893756 RepID=UPI001E3B30EA|nr:helix-turn-helix domain-containing protein [Myroides oncorhynchi]MCC9042834.1 helix-turn-helix domain-containing protein [Myroides oncorhynchi]
MTSTASKLSVQTKIVELKNTQKDDFLIFSQEESSTVLSPLNKRNYYKLSYLKTKSKFFDGTRIIELEGPSLFFSNPVSHYTFEPVSEYPEGYFCLFNNNFLGYKSNLLKSILAHLHENPIYLLTPKQDEFISFIFKRMNDESDQKYAQKYELLRNYIEIIIHQSNKLNASYTVDPSINAPQRLCARFLEILEKQFPITRTNTAIKLKTPGDFAELLNIHVNHLNHTLKKTLGKCTTDCIQERILIESQKLLKSTTWSVAEIGYCLGFEYPTYFSSFFKRYTRLTPNEYRKN